MHENTFVSHKPIDTVCCEEHRHLGPSDYIVAASSFTIPGFDHDGDMIPTQKFALMVAVDRPTINRGGVTITPRVTMELLDQFAELMQTIVGPDGMAAAMVQAVIRKYGATVLEDASVEDIAELVQQDRGGTPANPIVGGRRRGDYVN